MVKKMFSFSMETRLSKFHVLLLVCKLSYDNDK